jgi:threonine dehydrogenase-like Zn-dependent dehydrogenase
LIIGACRDTGGGWSQYFVAHKSQVFRIPENVTDENAILIDAFCSALHPVMRNFPGHNDVVLVIGVGVIGLCVVIALRALGSKAHVVALAKYDFQGELAKKYGADEVIYNRGDYYKVINDSLGGKLYKPVLGKRVIVGGADLVFECIGSEESIDDALRFTKSGGKVVLVGLATIPKRVDWTPIWLNELVIKGSFGCSNEIYNGKRMPTYQIALNLMSEGKLDLSPLLTHKFNLADYRDAIATTTKKGRNKVVKTVFMFQ